MMTEEVTKKERVRDMIPLSGLPDESIFILKNDVGQDKTYTIVEHQKGLPKKTTCTDENGFPVHLKSNLRVLEVSRPTPEE